MRLHAFTIENFRAYQVARRIEFEDLTAIIGRNDVGKSTILEALEIFFNNAAIKIESSDANVRSGSKTVTLTAEFTNLPSKIILDSGAETTLQAEYLLDTNGSLTIQKVIDCGKAKPSIETYVIAEHPTANGFDQLLQLKEADLQALIKKHQLTAALKGNPGMRQALWESAKDLNIQTVAIPVSKPKEDSKRIWEQIDRHLPYFALFQSDRPSKDSDGEIQNPLKGAIAAAIAEVQNEIKAIQDSVREKSEEIAKLTHEALKSIDPYLAGALAPNFSPPTAAKWVGLFNIGMNTEDDIPLNKRGSGVRRLILVSFFKAEAERRLSTSNKSNIIYAIEEPETSQHPANQRVLIESFQDMAQTANCQVILTTHSPGLASELPIESIRFVSNPNPQDTPEIRHDADVYGDVADTLGVTPDNRVKVIICVEGPTDVVALKQLSATLNQEDETIPNLLNDPRCAFITLGGSTLKYWVNDNYLKGLGRPEVHIYDSDVAKYADEVKKINEREDGLGSWATQTSKHEIESYLHSDAIKATFGVEVNVVDQPTDEDPAAPKAFATAYSAHKKFDGVMKDSTAKQYLVRVFKNMTVEQIQERDPEGELEGWFRRIAGYF